jgi:undecaprenyl-diphosphatase
VDSLAATDAGLALLGAWLAEENPSATAWLVRAAESPFAKSLLFAPWLLVAWSRGGADERERVLATPASCGIALATTWVVTTLWRRPRPLHPASGLEEVAAAFRGYAEAHPGWLHWGSFPSDHAAYLTALGLGLYSLNRGMGTAALAVGIGACCLARMSVGLHYASDVVAGVAVGALAHLAVSSAHRGFAAALFRRLRDAVEANAWLQLGFALLVVEMAVMFRDLRALDTLLFPLPH